MTIEQVTAFLAWCTALNFALLIIATLALWLMQDIASRFHGALFRLPGVVLQEQYFQYLATWKILIIVFNLVPYLALRLM